MIDLNEARIYCGTYGKYNSGSIEGRWLDINDYSTKEEFYQACAELHSNEHDPEYMFQDYENIPSGMVGESWISEKFWELLEATADWDEDRTKALFVFVELYELDLESDPETIIQNFEDSYQGDFSGSTDPRGDFTYDFVEMCGYLNDCPETVKNYFDYSAYERDLFMDGYSESEGHIFNDNY